MSEAQKYSSGEGLFARMFLEEGEEVASLAEEPKTGFPWVQMDKRVQTAGRIPPANALVDVSHFLPSFHDNTWNQNVGVKLGDKFVHITEGMMPTNTVVNVSQSPPALLGNNWIETVWDLDDTVQAKTIILADVISIAVKLPPIDSNTIRRLFVALDEDDEHGDDSDSASDELIRLIESLGKPALEFLELLIEESASYTNAFRALEILGYIEQENTRDDRIEIALRMLSNRRAPVRHAAISVVAALRAEEALTPLESLVHSDLSTLNRKLAQRAIEKIHALS